MVDTGPISPDDPRAIRARMVKQAKDVLIELGEDDKPATLPQKIVTGILVTPIFVTILVAIVLVCYKAINFVWGWAT